MMPRQTPAAWRISAVSPPFISEVMDNKKPTYQAVVDRIEREMLADWASMIER
jgi:hypothetical protein